jgi:hypothetical protein
MGSLLHVLAKLKGESDVATGALRMLSLVRWVDGLAVKTSRGRFPWSSEGGAASDVYIRPFKVVDAIRIQHVGLLLQAGPRAGKKRAWKNLVRKPCTL